MTSDSRSTDLPPRPPLLRQLTGLDADQQAERLAYFDLGPADRQGLRDMAELAERTVDGVVAEFYRMGGRVALASRPGETVFAVTLPAHDPTAA
jgi:hypothetical protein